ncbi:Kinase [Hexamita inflata]|uniref:non-specific serine/threonine protein kinase n=1 Tax=Hexamita inflata TaxID=28002 RepID=A0AA86QGB3_9EUKA|nr:Kinase [Hexamita inflata]
MPILRLIKSDIISIMFERFIKDIPLNNNQKLSDYIYETIFPTLLKYKIIKTLGKGTYGIVYQVCKNDKMLAIKCPFIRYLEIQHEQTQIKNARSIIIQEYFATQRFHQSCKRFSLQPQRFHIYGPLCAIQMEYFDGKDLIYFLHQQNYDYNKICIQMQQITVELEKCGIIHNDIKLDNFLFDEKVLKLIDFGRSQDMIHTRKQFENNITLQQVNDNQFYKQVLEYSGPYCLISKPTDFIIHYLQQDKAAVIMCLYYLQQQSIQFFNDQKFKFPVDNKEKICQLINIFGAQKIESIIKLTGHNLFGKRCDLEDVLSSIWDKYGFLEVGPLGMLCETLGQYNKPKLNKENINLNELFVK